MIFMQRFMKPEMKVKWCFAISKVTSNTVYMLEMP